MTASVASPIQEQQRGSKRKASSFRNQAPTKHPPRNIEKRLLSNEKDDLQIRGQQTTRIKSNTKKGEGSFRTSRSCEMLPAGLAASGSESPVPQSLHRRPFRLSHLPTALPPRWLACASKRAKLKKQEGSGRRSKHAPSGGRYPGKRPPTLFLPRPPIYSIRSNNDTIINPPPRQRTGRRQSPFCADCNAVKTPPRHATQRRRATARHRPDIDASVS